MSEEKIETLSTEKLNKRKKFATILMVILVAAFVLDGAAFVYDLSFGHGFNASLFVPAIACLVILLSISIGRKKIEAELRNRSE